MERIIFFIFLISISASMQAQNIGIGTNTPSRKFTVRQDGIGITQENTDGAIQIGFFTNNSVAFLQTHTAHPLAFATNNGAAQMLLSTAGNFGIGSTSPTLAGLVVDKKVGAVNALFGGNTSGVAIESNYPGIGLNTYYNAGRKSISAGYGGWLGLDPNTGDLIFQSSATAGIAGIDLNLTTKLQIDKNGLVGIGTTTINPTAQLHVDVGTSITKGLLVTGTYNSSAVVPDLGAGTRLTFYPGKAAFRAGYVVGTHWNNANVGLYSTALGYNTTASGYASIALGAYTIASGTYTTATGYTTTASGDNSTAMGYYTIASGSYSTAIGLITTASGDNSTAMGSQTYASGEHSTAMGYHTNATSYYSTAMGYYTDASGLNSTAMGRNTTASGAFSTAMGATTTASGSYSTAMGKEMNTNNKDGAFAIGDSDPNNEGVVNSALADQFTARFWNGYYLLTSGNTDRFGVSIAHNGNAWVSICDSNRKENIEPLNGEMVLQKLSNINFHSWNYKQQDARQYRHYGIMAQDFYAAFGKDSYGTIGNDTTVNPVDMIGIDMAAIKALEKRTADLKSQNEVLDEQNKKLQLIIYKLDERLRKLEK